MRRPSPIIPLSLALLLTSGSTLLSQDAVNLEEVLELVGENYPKLLGADVERQVADAKFLEKQGAFDPKVSFKSEQLSFLNGTQETQKRKNQLTFEVPTRSGIKWIAGARLSDTSLTGKKGTKDYERGILGLEIPLIRNARWNAKLTAERQADLGRPLALAEFQATRLELLQSAGEAYWDWVASVQSLAVATEMVELARSRAEAISQQVSRGDKPELVSVEAEREVHKRLGILAKAERNIQKTGLKLALYLWDEEGNPLDPFDASQAPRTFPLPEDLGDEEVEVAEAKAIELRPGLQAVQIRKKITDLDLALARNDGNPDLSIFFNSGAESPLDVFEPIERRLRAGLKVSVPLRRRSPRGRSAAARLKLRKLELENVLLRQRILTEVRDAASRLRTDQDRFQAASKELELALKLEQGERTRFEFGEGTLFLVNSRERYRAEAQIKQIEVAADYQHARLGFRAVTADF